MLYSYCFTVHKGKTNLSYKNSYSVPVTASSKGTKIFSPWSECRCWYRFAEWGTSFWLCGLIMCIKLITALVENCFRAMVRNVRWMLLKITGPNSAIQSCHLKSRSDSCSCFEKNRCASVIDSCAEWCFLSKLINLVLCKKWQLTPQTRGNLDKTAAKDKEETLQYKPPDLRQGKSPLCSWAYTTWKYKDLEGNSTDSLCNSELVYVRAWALSEHISLCFSLPTLSCENFSHLWTYTH